MIPDASSQQRTTYRQVLAVSRFRLLLTTSTLAMAADSLRIATLSMLIYATTGSPLLSAVTFGIGFLPQLIGSTLLGALADRVRPRRLIASGYAVECGTAAALALADLPVAASLALVAVVACVTPVFGGASNRLIGEALTGDAYVVVQHGELRRSVGGPGRQRYHRRPAGAAPYAAGWRCGLRRRGRSRADGAARSAGVETSGQAGLPALGARQCLEH
jgi:hypothetical protein